MFFVIPGSDPYLCQHPGDLKGSNQTLTLYAPGKETVAGDLAPVPPVTVIWAHSILRIVSSIVKHFNGIDKHRIVRRDISLHYEEQ
jgi:hypothetical protein